MYNPRSHKQFLGLSNYDAWSRIIFLAPFLLNMVLASQSKTTLPQPLQPDPKVQLASQVIEAYGRGMIYMVIECNRFSLVHRLQPAPGWPES